MRLPFIKQTWVFIIGFLTQQATPEIVTLTGDGGQVAGARIDVRANHVARLLSWPRLSDGEGLGEFEIWIGGYTNRILQSSFYMFNGGQSTLTTSPVMVA